MFKSLLDTIKNFDIKIKKILTNGLYFSLFVSIIGTLCLIYYITLSSSNFIYYIGIKIIWLSLCFAVYFLSCAIAFDKIKKDLDF